MVVEKIITGFGVSLAASLASSSIAGNPLEKDLEEACANGARCFAKHFGDRDSWKGELKRLLGWTATQSCFERIVENNIKNESTAGDVEKLESLIREAEIEIDSIEGFETRKAVESFWEGFNEKAKLSKGINTYLTMYYTKVIKDSVKPTPLDLDKLKDTYFRFLREKYARLSFKGLSEGRLLSIPLKELYTTPDLVAPYF